MRDHHRAGKLVLLIVPLLALGVGLLASPLLRVEQVTVVAPTPELAAEVSRQLEVPRDASVLLYPLCHLCAQARSCYRVEECTVRRQLPHGLLVAVTARQPIAALRDPEGFTTVSREGICLYRQGSAPALPLFAGLTPARPQLGTKIGAEQWTWARDLLAGAAKIGLREGLVSDFTMPHQITIKTRAGWKCTLGNVNSLMRKMAIVGQLAAQLQREGRTPRTIDVSLPEQPRWTAT